MAYIQCKTVHYTTNDFGVHSSSHRGVGIFLITILFLLTFERTHFRGSHVIICSGLRSTFFFYDVELWPIFLCCV